MTANLAILSLQDMVSSLSPWRTPSHVWIVLLERTGMVPSPDSILVRSCPRAFLFGCLSPWSDRGNARKRRCDAYEWFKSNHGSSISLPNWAACLLLLSGSPSIPASWGEKMRASPHGEVLMYRWNWTFSFSLKPCLLSHLVKMDLRCSSSWLLGTKKLIFKKLYHIEYYRKCIIYNPNAKEKYNLREQLAGKCKTHLRKCSSWEYRYLMRERRATISAWQSFRAKPLSLIYSPLMHFVPVDTQMTSASFTSEPGQENINPPIQPNFEFKSLKVLYFLKMCDTISGAEPRWMHRRENTTDYMSWAVIWRFWPGSLYLFS